MAEEKNTDWHRKGSYKGKPMAIVEEQDKRFTQVYLRELSLLEKEAKEMYSRKPTEDEVYSLYKKILDLGTKKTGGFDLTFGDVENPRKINMSSASLSKANEKELLRGIAQLAKEKGLEKVKNLQLPILEKPANIYPTLYDVIASIKDDIRQTKIKPKEEPRTTTDTDEKPMTSAERKVYEKKKKEEERKKVKYGPNYIEELSQDKYETLQKLIAQRKQIEEDFQKEIQSLNKVMVSANTSLDFSSLKIDLVYDTPKKVKEVLLDKEIIDKEQQKQVRDLYPAMIKYQQYMKELGKEQKTYGDKLLESLKKDFGQMMVEDKKGEEKE